VTKDGNSPQEERMMSMLLAGRAEIAIGREDAALALLETAPFRNAIEILPRPFVSTPTYLAFRKSLAEEEPGYVKAVWSEIGRLREEPGWEEKARRLLRAPTRAR
jgi:ABC-type amino acid transport substrate-binding protein